MSTKIIWCPIGANYNGSAKAKLRISGIYFIASTHVETAVQLKRSLK